MLLVKVVFLLISALQLSYAYPDGADPASCQNMMPDHGVPAQTSPAPFTVTTSAASVSPGQTLNVFITRTNTVTVLRGFMIEARSATGAVIGQFLPTAGMRTMLCAPAPPGGTATHSSPDLRTAITFNWVPPASGFAGNVVFHVTALQDFITFWTGLQSAAVAVNP